MDRANNRKNKARLEEAIHPEIGNEAAWEENVHALNLRSADPVKSLDDRLLDESQLKAIQEKWNKDLKTGESINEPEQSDKVQGEITESVIDGKIGVVQDDVITTEAVEIPVPESNFDAEEQETEKATKPGKRIRKVAEKAKKEEARKKEEKLKSRNLKESNLSDFTSWLKGLTGSEYVHPYEDDYAIHQGLASEDEGISETFADLLAAQGYKDQAIAMYTRLIEKFPEKSRFFAAKIEALQS